jgi:hypothetical protein
MIIFIMINYSWQGHSNQSNRSASQQHSFNVRPAFYPPHKLNFLEQNLPENMMFWKFLNAITFPIALYVIVTEEDCHELNLQ